MNIPKLFTNTKERKQSTLSKYIGIDGWLTPNEAQGLFEVAFLLPKSAKVVEIGSWKGKSTYCIATGLKSGTIFCIDPFNADGEVGSKEIYEETKGAKSLLEQFKHNLTSIPKSVQVNAMQGYSKAFVGAFSEIDFLFIDGDHSIEGCQFDYENFSPSIKVGGYLAFHDYYGDRPELGPTYVIDNLVRKNPDFTFYNSFDSLHVFQRI